MPLFKLYFLINMNNFNETVNLTITSNNSIIFDPLKFNLSILYDKLAYFYISYDINNSLYFAYPFDEYALLSEKYPISGHIVKSRPLDLIYSGILSNEDIKFFNSLEQRIDEEYAYLYKYNVINLYIELSLAIRKIYNSDQDCIFERDPEFHIFITKYDITKSYFEDIRENFYNNCN